MNNGLILGIDPTELHNQLKVAHLAKNRGLSEDEMATSIENWREEIRNLSEKDEMENDAIGEPFKDPEFKNENDTKNNDKEYVDQKKLSEPERLVAITRGMGNKSDATIISINFEEYRKSCPESSYFAGVSSGQGICARDFSSFVVNEIAQSFAGPKTHTQVTQKFALDSNQESSQMAST